jgi:hypothetical protein
MKAKTKISILIISLLLLSGLLNVFVIKRNNVLKQDYSRQLNNVSALTDPIKTDTIHDTASVGTQGVVSETVQELNRQSLLDKQLIKDLKLKIKDLSNISTISVSNSDSVPLTKQADSIYNYKDYWTNIKVNIPASTCTYNTRDSLQTYLYVLYKHHFLWWKWGKIGYNIKIVNFNPHSRIIYSRIINIEK